MEGKLENFMKECERWRNQGRAHIFLIQEHNIDPKREGDVRDLASNYKFHISIHFAKLGKDGVHRGGTLTLIDSKVAELRNEDKLDDGGGALVTSIDWAGNKIDILNVYAPAKPGLRIDFFRDIRNKLHKNMIAMGDWNCVPNVLLDVQSQNPMNYANTGAALL